MLLAYCCTIWGNTDNLLIDSIVKFQKRTARTILVKTIEIPSSILFFSLVLDDTSRKSWIPKGHSDVTKSFIARLPLISLSFSTTQMRFIIICSGQPMLTFCMCFNLTLTILKTFSAVLVLKSGTPCQTVSNIQSQFRTSRKILGVDIF